MQKKDTIVTLIVVLVLAIIAFLFLNSRQQPNEVTEHIGEQERQEKKQLLQALRGDSVVQTQQSQEEKIILLRSLRGQ